MKTFTHPKGLFEMKIPLDWIYKNEIAGYKNESPFSFEPHQNSCGCFQVSIYHKSEKEIFPNLPIQKYNTNGLEFVENILPKPDCKILLWAAVVEDYSIMAKYIYEPSNDNKRKVNEELRKVRESLSSLMCLSKSRWEFAIGFDRYEKLNISLAASFDLKNNALENRSFVQLIVITANQIDAYLRISIALKYQIKEKTNLLKVKYLHQRESDKPIMEKKIYDEAKSIGIIDEKTHKSLYELYNLRNKVVHRYIITDIKTYELLNICYEYESICETIRHILADIELEQYEKKIGYFSSKNPHRERSGKFINELYAMINEKHLYSEYEKNINNETPTG